MITVHIWPVQFPGQCLGDCAFATCGHAYEDDTRHRLGWTLEHFGDAVVFFLHYCSIDILAVAGNPSACNLPVLLALQARTSYPHTILQ